MVEKYIYTDDNIVVSVKAVAKRIDIKIADEIFIATALLHNEHPDRADFTIDEIVRRVAEENISGGLRPGLQVHVTAHCVANRSPKPATLRMLYATGRSTRRLYKPGDPVEPGRIGRSAPERKDIPARYHYLLDWYHDRYANAPAENPTDWLSGIWKMVGTGQGMWKDEDPDAYVRQLREGWE